MKRLLLLLSLLMFTRLLYSQLQVTAVGINATCSGNGKVQASTIGGLSPMTFDLRDGSGNIIKASQLDSLFTGLSAGTYRVGVYDVNHNQVPVTSNTVTITSSYTTLKITSITPSTGAIYSCTANSLAGTAYVTYSGGLAPFSVNAQSGPVIPAVPVVTNNNSGTVNGLSSGSYTFSVSDACGNAVASSAVSVSGTATVYPASSNFLLGNPAINFSIQPGKCGPQVFLNLLSGVTSLRWYMEYPTGSGFFTDTFNTRNFFPLPYYDPNFLTGKTYTLWTQHPCTGVWASTAIAIPSTIPIAPSVDGNSSLYITNNCDSVMPYIQPHSADNPFYCYPVHLTIANINNPSVYYLDTTYSNGGTVYQSYKVPGSGTYIVRLTDAQGSFYEKTITVSAFAPRTLSNSTQINSCDLTKSLLSMYGVSPGNVFPVTFNLLSLPGDPSPDQAVYPPISISSSPATNQFIKLWPNLPALTSGNARYEVVWNCRRDTFSFNIARFPYSAVVFDTAIISVPAAGCSSGKANVNIKFHAIDTLGKVISSPGSLLYVKMLTPSVNTYYNTNGNFSIQNLDAGKTYTFGVFANIDASLNCQPLTTFIVQTPNYGTPSIDVNKTFGLVCSGQLTGNLVIVANGFPTLQYQIQKPGDPGFGSYQSGNTFTNLTAGFYNVRVKDGCGNETFQSVQVVDASAVSLLTSVGDISGKVCEGNAATLTFHPIGPVSGITWSVPGRGAVPDSLNITIPSFSAANNGSYTVSALSTTGCTLTGTISLDNAPLPTVARPSGFSVCSDDYTAPVIFSQTPGATINWTNDKASIGLAASGTGDISSFKGINSTASPIQAHITATPRLGGCTGQSQNFTITVNPLPVANFSVNTSSQCQYNNLFQFTNNSTGTNPLDYYWDLGDGTISYSKDVSHHYLSPGNNTVLLRVTSANLCQSVLTKQITVKVSPVAAFTYQVVSPNSNEQFQFVNNSTTSSGTLSYHWDFGDGTTSTEQSPVHTYAGSGLYQVTLTVTNSDGCSVSASESLSVSTDPNIIVTASAAAPVQCFTGNSFQFTNTTTIQSGSVIAYDWDFGDGYGVSSASAPVYSYATPGSYVVTLVATTNTGFQLVSTVSVIVNEMPVADRPANRAVCNGQTIGDIVFNSTDPATTFTWTNNHPEAGLPANGSGYRITSFAATNNTTSPIVANITIVPVANGCTGDFQSFDITVYPSPLLQVQQPSVTCAPGVADITAPSVTAGSSAGTLTYWQDSGTDISLLNANSIDVSGIYFIKLENTFGCSAISPVDIVINSPQLSIQNPAIVCYGSSVNLTAPAVTAGSSSGLVYTYYADSGGTVSLTQPQSVSLSGTYYIKGTDPVSFCQTDLKPVLVQIASRLNIISSTMPVTCNGGSNGAIFISATGGTTPYTYNWTGPNGFTSSLDDIEGLKAGDYSVIVTDGFGCALPAIPITVSEPEAINIISLPIDINCNGDSTGAIETVISGGFPDYTFVWTGPDQFVADSLNISGLKKGQYVLTVTDGAGCIATATSVVSEESAIRITEVVTDVACGGDSSGRIDVSVSGGTGPAYSYQWTGVNGYNASTATITGLRGGTYQLLVTDQAGCTATISRTVDEPSTINIFETHQDVSGLGNDGSINITVNNGVPPYTFSWTGPGGYTSSGEDISNLIPGNYGLTVTDANSCTTSINVFIAALEDLHVSESHQNVTCSGYNDGAITMTVTGGTEPYAYSWTGPGGFSAASKDISGLIAGSYAFTFSDNAAHVSTGTIVIGEPATIKITPVVKEVSCNGANDGAINISILRGAINDYTYSWTGPSGFASSNQNINNLVAGSYNITVADSVGCFSTNTVLVSQPSLIKIIGLVSGVTCNGGNDGAIRLTIERGLGSGYIYQWTGPNGFTSTKANIDSLKAGNYSVIVTDGAGCSSSSVFVVGQPSLIRVAAISSNVTCYGGNNGAVTINVSGGSGSGYTFTWAGPNGFTSSNRNLTGLVAGNYVVSVTDGAGCKSSYYLVFISEPSPLTISGAIETIKCNTGSNDTGAIRITATGGTGQPYSYLWSGPGGFTSTSQNISGIGAGTYLATVTDGMGCSKTSEPFVLNMPRPLTIATRPASSGCNENPLGSVSLDVTGGTPPYSYLWSNGAMTQNIIRLLPGTYNVTVTDVNGCTQQSGDNIITIPPPVNLVTNAPSAVCAPGTVDITLPGITAGSDAGLRFGYYIDSAATRVLNLPNRIAVTGTYFIKGVNVSGCQSVKPVGVTIHPASPKPDISASGPLLFCMGDSVVLEALTVGASLYQWYDKGVIINTVTQKFLTVKHSGVFTVTAQNDNGCISDISNKVTVKASVVPDLIVIPADTVVSRGSEVLLSAISGSLGMSGNQFSWSPTTGLDNPNDPVTKARIVNDIVYTATLIQQGCTVQKTSTIKVNATIDVFPSKLVTPDGDGINDRFVIKNIDVYPDNELQIFDKSGKLLYKKSGYNNEWEGRVNGRIVPNDTYYYILTIQGKVYKKGSITVIHSY